MCMGGDGMYEIPLSGRRSNIIPFIDICLLSISPSRLEFYLQNRDGLSLET